MDTSGIDIKAVIDQLCSIRWQKESTVKGARQIKGGPCPLCGIGTDRFIIWPNGSYGNPMPHFYCGIHGNGCKEHGDVISFVQKLRGYSTAYQAIRELEAMGYGVGGSDYTYTYTPARESTPGEKWQTSGKALVHAAEKYLWSHMGVQALEYLHQRGLTDEMIKFFHLGFWPEWTEYQRDVWGLPEKVGKPTFKIPRGITIPIFESDTLWSINIRISPKDIAQAEAQGKKLPRYMQVLGSKNELFNVDSIKPGKPVFVTEGEFDAIIGQQETGYSFVATGGTKGAMMARCVARLSLASHIILAFDNDGGKGEAAADEWIKIFGDKATLWLPTVRKDITDMWSQGIDISTWASTAINLVSPVPEIVSVENVPAAKVDAASAATEPEQTIDIVPLLPDKCLLCDEEVEYFISADKAYCKHHYDESTRPRDLSRQEERDALVATYKRALPGWKVTVGPRCTPALHIVRIKPTEQTKRRTPDGYWTRKRAKLQAQGYYEHLERENVKLAQRVQNLPRRIYASPVPKFEWMEDKNGVRHLVQSGYWSEY
jgi:DNA primase